MDKRAIILKLVVMVMVAAILFLSLSAYIKFSRNNVEITTGDVTINIDYNNTENNDAQTDTISFPSNSPDEIDVSPADLKRTNQTNQSQ